MTDEEASTELDVRHGTPATTSEMQTQRKRRRKPNLYDLKQFIVRLSDPASQISRRIISFVGLLLVITTLLLGIFHLLDKVDFVATILAGTVICIAGMLTSAQDDRSTLLAALLTSPDAEVRAKAENAILIQQDI
jgi:hypothetical protein